MKERVGEFYFVIAKFAKEGKKSSSCCRIVMFTIWLFAALQISAKRAYLENITINKLQEGSIPHFSHLKPGVGRPKMHYSK